MLYCTEMNSFVGKITIISDDTYLRFVWIEGQQGFDTKACTFKETPILCKTKEWLKRYFNNQKPDIKELPIWLEGTSFQRFIWDELCKIPYGEVVTYKQLAEAAAKKFHKAKMSAQAVGGAVGRNPISIIIPCHRVIGSNSTLVGYQGGLDMKVKLLKHENIIVGNLL